LVLKPAALFSLRNDRKLFPVAVDLVLIFAIHHKRKGFVKGKVVLAGAVHGSEPLPLQHEVGEHQRALLVGFHARWVAHHYTALRILEYREVELGGLLRLAVHVPYEQERRDNKRSHPTLWV